MDSPTADDDSAGEGADSREKFVLAVDIGTTSLRSHVYTKQGNIKGASSKRVRIVVLKRENTHLSYDWTCVI